jgi:hypothetical protein
MLRDSAGSIYYEELSRQVAELFEKLLTKSGGIMTLIDAYCLFNRTRGSCKKYTMKPRLRISYGFSIDFSRGYDACLSIT